MELRIAGTGGQVPFTAAVLGLSIVASRDGGELGAWFAATWGFAKQILPLLLVGVLVAGLLLGRPGHDGLIPSAWVSSLVGGNSFGANLFASVFGAFMYFATLTEVPILQGLLGSGMGQGPALALLLAGPALSLPSMLVLTGIWQGVGWGTIIYLAAISSIDPEMYEAAEIDGASRLQPTLAITIARRRRCAGRVRQVAGSAASHFRLNKYGLTYTKLPTIATYFPTNPARVIRHDN